MKQTIHETMHNHLIVGERDFLLCHLVFFDECLQRLIAELHQNVDFQVLGAIVLIDEEPKVVKHIKGDVNLFLNNF